ncbi:MAG TPA: hypothetical protein VG737_12085 [Cyclobacteriaceae bacterium]|nr:hypothetical protein [Cyclobacteriaceae bacterium]
MLRRIVVALITLLTIALDSHAQKQLVFMRRGAVIARYTEGEEIKCVLKNKRRTSGFIVELEDFRMITSNDTINFLAISKIDTRKHNPIDVRKGIGGLLFLGGIVYLSVDQLNAALGYSKPGFDQADWNAVIATGVGAAILFIRPKYKKLKQGTIIRAIDHRSPFYLR